MIYPSDNLQFSSLLGGYIKGIFEGPCAVSMSKM